jgi:glycosyltransferase involved in cell wall biosynthesis
MFDPDADGKRIREQWGLNGQFVVIYAGALGLANDIPTVLRAAASLKERTDVRFVLVGDGKERRNLEVWAKEHQLTNVLFAGSHPKSEMSDILAASDVCLATLKNISMFRTTYPNKVFDYMAAGRPTILGIDGVIRQVVETAQGGVFVPPGDSAALADAVRQLAENRSLAQEMGQAARTYVVEHFNRSKQAHDFVALIERLQQK